MPGREGESANATTSLETQLSVFFGEHYSRMTRLAALICHEPASAEDAVQAAMEQAWRRRASLREPNRLRWWLDRIVVREAIRINRRWTPPRRTDRLTAEDAARLRDHEARVGPARLILDAAFGQLPVEQRAAIVLHLHAGYTVQETARLMGSAVETTRSRLRLARQRLRSELQEAMP
jgi:RNA polymerase sigma-70 factor, ECF subfamily